jgi:hypothetical protein
MQNSQSCHFLRNHHQHQAHAREKPTQVVAQAPTARKQKPQALDAKVQLPNARENKLQKALVQCGMLNAVDGSEDNN